MQLLYNHSGELIAYHHQNMLIHPEDLNVMGLVLGNCVFDQQARIIGKLFQEKVYNVSGEVLASQAKDSLPLPGGFDIHNSILHAWEILVMIKDHSCPFVNPKNAWSTASLAECLYA